MKKRVLAAALAVVMSLACFAALPATASAEESGEYEYELLSNGTAQITGVSGNVSEIVIPDTIDGYTVTSIGDSAFANNADITSVVISDTVTEIGANAFNLCSNLAELDLGNSVETIGKYAFSASTANLTSITIPDSVTYIDEYAFFNKSLDLSCVATVTIGSGVTYIGDGAFNWHNIENVYYSGTQDEWNNITVDGSNDCLLNATLHCAGADDTDTATDSTYRDEFIDALLEQEDEWNNSYYYFIDLNFDGQLEFVTGWWQMTVEYEETVYCYSDGDICSVGVLYRGAPDYNDTSIGLSSEAPPLVGYYDTLEDKYVILGESSSVNAAGAICWDVNYMIDYNGANISEFSNSLKYYSTRYIFYCFEDDDYYNNDKRYVDVKYYDGANDFIYLHLNDDAGLSGCNEITEDEYNAINDSMLENLVNINMTYDTIDSSTWSGYTTTSEKRAALEAAYDSFSYDRYAVNTDTDTADDTTSATSSTTSTDTDTQSSSAESSSSSSVASSGSSASASASSTTASTSASTSSAAASTATTGKSSDTVTTGDITCAATVAVVLLTSAVLILAVRKRKSEN